MTKKQSRAKTQKNVDIKQSIQAFNKRVENEPATLYTKTQAEWEKDAQNLEPLDERFLVWLSPDQAVYDAISIAVSEGQAQISIKNCDSSGAEYVLISNSPNWGAKDEAHRQEIAQRMADAYKSLTQLHLHDWKMTVELLKHISEAEKERNLLRVADKSRSNTLKAIASIYNLTFKVVNETEG